MMGAEQKEKLVNLVGHDFSVNDVLNEDEVYDIASNYASTYKTLKDATNMCLMDCSLAGLSYGQTETINRQILNILRFERR